MYTYTSPRNVIPYEFLFFRISLSEIPPSNVFYGKKVVSNQDKVGNNRLRCALSDLKAIWASQVQPVRAILAHQSRE